MYEVYVCKVDNVIVYIGHGYRGRHKHCVSGKSHVYGLNEVFFSEKRDNMTVRIHAFYGEKEIAEIVERDLIKKHRPLFNSVYINTERQKEANKVVDFKSKMIKGVPSDNLWIYSKDGVSYREVLDEFLKFHLYEDFMKVGFELHDRNFYSKFGFKKLSNLVRKNYDPNSSSWKDVFKRNLIKYTGCGNLK